jgi:uridine kinase
MKPHLQIAIVGGSGAGKSWLADRLIEALPQVSSRISLDDYYRDLSALPPADREDVNFDDPASIDWHSMAEVMDRLRHCQPIEVPSYNFHSHTRDPIPRQVTPMPVMIWDGLWLLHQDEIRSRFDWSCFLDCDEGERLDRRLARDARERGRSPDAVRKQFLQQVQPMHLDHVEPQRWKASQVIQAPVTDAQVQDLAARLRSMAGITSHHGRAFA